MSKEILETLIKLFALISRQDGGVTQLEYDFIKAYLIAELNEELANQYIDKYRDLVVGIEDADDQETIIAKRAKFEIIAEKHIVNEIRVTESVRITRTARKIAEAKLDQNQKILILVRLFELIAIDGKYTPSRKFVMEGVADYFNLKSEWNDIGAFVMCSDAQHLQFLTDEFHPRPSVTSAEKKDKTPEEIQQLELNNERKRKEGIAKAHEEILIVSENAPASPDFKHYEVEGFEGQIIFKYIVISDAEINKTKGAEPDKDKKKSKSSNGIYFVKYVNTNPNVTEDLKRNGFPMKTSAVYLYPNGSTIRTSKGINLYYSDVNAYFIDTLKSVKLSFQARKIEFKFPNGVLGVQTMDLSYPQGRLVGIMGGSGAGKTTLMNALSGIETPSSGAVLINGVDVHKEPKKIEGVIGFIAQDDLLIEDLTVYQNLYYNAKLCLAKLSEKEIDERVMETLESLGLDHIRDIKVGNVLNKKISGGQRKRLNIALELIREPAVMFVDEPTSGLSSKDSQNVVDLLKELALKGKLIFVVIHQPSADIYKTFDEMIILDRGGYLVYRGNPIEAIKYFKRETRQADADREQDNPEEMFKIIEKEVNDDYGRETGKRQFTPEEWSKRFKSHPEYPNKEVETINESPPSSLARPNLINQSVLFTVRDFLAKISNTQYMLINLLEAPLLAVLLAFIIRFQNEPKTGNYIFRYNDNVPAYVLICIIISMFMGLTVSAEEIIKDRKIQKREQFLNLSRFGYLSSKLIILFLLSAIQTLSFVLIGNAILGIQGELFSYWGILFAVSCFSNVLGLNISSTFNSVITIYITIPLLLIPQMILSGIIFRYEKMNKTISEKGTVPLLADVMVSRWAFEAIIVDHFMMNAYQKDYYNLEKKISQDNFKISFWIPALKERLDRSVENKNIKSEEATKNLKKDLELVRKEIRSEKFHLELLSQDWETTLTTDQYSSLKSDKIRAYLDTITNRYQTRVNDNSKDKEDLIDLIKEKRDKKYDITKQKNTYFNDLNFEPF